MEVLEATLAFAVLMIVFSTVTTAISELILRSFHMRARCLRRAMESLYDQVIGSAWPADGNAAAPALRQDFLRQLLGNPASGGAHHLASGDLGASTRRRAGWVARIGSFFTNSPQTDKLTARAFAERLGRSWVGQRLFTEHATRADSEIDAVVTEYTRTFDRFSRGASEVYRRNAQVIALFTAMVVAFGFGVDSTRVFGALIENPQLRNTIVAGVDEAGDGYRLAEQRYRQAFKASQENTDEEAKRELEEAQAQVDEYLERIETLQSVGLPIGQSYALWCDVPALFTEHQAETCNGPGTLLEYVVAFVGTALAGILIGLGGPFWFRVFASLSQVAQLLRSVGVGNNHRSTEPEKASTSNTVEESFVPENVVDAFLSSAQIIGRGPSVPRARGILDPTGLSPREGAPW